MTITVILKILSYLAPAGAVAFFFIRHNIKKNQEHQKELDGKDGVIHSLRDEILQIIEIQAEVKDIEEQNKAIKKAIADNPDIDSAYADRLSDMPKRNRRRTSKDS